MKEGWPAKGLIAPIWRRHGGRDALARRAGVNAQHLSKIENGRMNLGETVARKLVDAVPGLTLADLAAPAEVVDPSDRSVLGRLQRVETELETLRRQFDSYVEATTARLAALEAAPVTQAL